MVSYLAYILRNLGDQYDVYGDNLLLSSLRLLQDIPASAIVARRVRPACFFRLVHR